MLKYVLSVQSYGNDPIAGAIIVTNKITVEAKNDHGVKVMADKRKDVSLIEREDGSIVMSDPIGPWGDEFPYSTSRYTLGV